MPYRPLLLAVDESDNTLVLTLTGMFGLAGVGAVENALDRLSHAPVPTRVVFDLRAVTFLDGRPEVDPEGRRAGTDGGFRRGDTTTRHSQPSLHPHPRRRAAQHDRRARGGVTIPTEVKADHQHRLINQRLFRHYFVKCSCELGCSVCAYMGLVSTADAKHTPTSVYEAPSRGASSALASTASTVR